MRITLAGFELCHVTSYASNDALLADDAVTISGHQRRDAIRISRSWNVNLAGMPGDQRRALTKHLTTHHGPQAFWTSEFGGTPMTHSIRALVRVSSENHPIPNRGGPNILSSDNGMILTNRLSALQRSSGTPRGPLDFHGGSANLTITAVEPGW